MKNIVFLLCLFLIAFSEPLQAQTQPSSEVRQDTLSIKLRNRNQVFIISNSLRGLSDYQRADSLKNWFFQDLDKTLAQNDFPELPKRIYYLVNQNGKRRLKAEVAGETEPVFDLQMEKKRLAQDLPSLHYTIYDLPQNVEIHFFLEDSAAFFLARQANLMGAIQELKKDRRKLIGLTAYRLEQGGVGFEKRTPQRRTAIFLESNAFLGGMLVGSKLSPTVSFDLLLTLPHKTDINNFRIGFSYNTFVITEFRDGQFQSINPGDSWHFLWQFKYNQEKDTWVGITGGKFSTKDAIGLPKDAFKFGLQADYKRNSFSFESINLDKFSWNFKGKRQNQMYILTYRRAIL